MAEKLLIREMKSGLSFGIQVNPHSSRAEIAGIADGLLKVRVTAPPVEGAANDAVIALLSKKLGLKKSQMAIAAGTRGRKKSIVVNGVSRTELERKIDALSIEDRG
ncbi:MAG TPA: DUF167 family protein [Smithellaceae bacterium]|nr:DUF167 family protein [Smithellaceae bacterium]HQG81754.1 DUF167 family protein [Smithellaceae bacterium]